MSGQMAPDWDIQLDMAAVVCKSEWQKILFFMFSSNFYDFFFSRAMDTQDPV
jgi:hypothetical protein